MIVGWRALITVIFASLVVPRPGWGQSEQDNTDISVNYVYAAQLGIGTYDIGGLSVDVFSLPLAVTEPLPEYVAESLSASNPDDWQLRIKFPPTFGVFRFEQNDPDFGKIDIEQYTFAIVPGIELIAPVDDYWTLKPFADLGLGKVVASSGRGAGDNNFFVVYTTGLRSVVDVPIGNYDLAIGNGIIFAGNNEIGASVEEHYFAIETGLQIRRSLGFTLADIGISNSEVRGVEPEAGLYAIHYYFPDPLVFSRFRQAPLEVQNQIEIGVTLGSTSDWELFSVANPEIGASYIFGDDLSVFRINFGFPF